jgi:G:T-mismatch repair DNA endonuclease (very short patch repair protein)
MCGIPKNMRHVKIGKYFVDGYDKERNMVYEFLGDFWHGNPKKFKSFEFNKTTNCTFGDLYQKTLEREQQIKDLGYNLVVMWEYDWNKINNSIKTIQRKFRNSKLLL